MNSLRFIKDIPMLESAIKSYLRMGNPDNITYFRSWLKFEVGNFNEFQDNQLLLSRLESYLEQRRKELFSPRKLSFDDGVLHELNF